VLCSKESNLELLIINILLWLEFSSKGSDLQAAFGGTSLVLLLSPSHTLRSVLDLVSDYNW